MRFTYSDHAQIRMNQRSLSSRQVQESFHQAAEVKMHGPRFRRELLVDGLDVVVVYERRRGAYHVITVYVK